jgi:hypothetical protein
MKQQVNKTATSEAADILGTLAVLNRGNLIIDAGRDMQEVVNGIVATNKPGKITITLEIKPSGWDRDTGRATQVDITPEIATRIPKPDQGKSIFFLTEENRLTRDELDRQPLFEGSENK